MTIGNRISELRKEKGYTQEYVADQLGVSRQAVSKWELDQSSPDTKNLIGLSSLLGVSIEYIATGKIMELPNQNDYEWLTVRSINHKIKKGNKYLFSAIAAAIFGVVLIVMKTDINLIQVRIFGWVSLLSALILLIFSIVYHAIASSMEDDWKEMRRAKKSRESDRKQE